jgi:hypothetical protein
VCTYNPWSNGVLQELGSSEKDLHASLVVMVLVKFLYLFAASMLLGLSFGLGTSFLMKKFKSNSVPQVLTPLRAQQQSLAHC